MDAPPRCIFPTTMEAVPYTPELAETWDRLVDGARNGHFQWKRGYLDYHLDRFPGRSYLFRDGDRWFGGVAGHDWGEHGWASHRGLTFGGFFLAPETRTPQVRDMFNALHARLREAGKTVVRWRPLPWFHAREPSEEDRYFLFRLDARLVSRTLGTLVAPERLELSDKRRRDFAKIRRAGLRVERRHDWENFWPVLERNLQDRHGVRSVHTLDEIRLLATRFPREIELQGALLHDRWLGGLVLHRTPETLHIQYSAATDEGRANGVPYLLALEAGQSARGTSRWLSFGNSCEQGGLVLNDGLLAYKERFGGHGAVYEEYEYEPAGIPVDAL